jgi:hypothetical protein
MNTLRQRVAPLCPNILSNPKIAPRSFTIASWKQGAAGYGRVDGRDRDTKGSATLSIAALGIAMTYLLLVAAGAIGALLILLWLFQDAPGTIEKIGCEKIEGPRSAERLGPGGTSSVSVEPECWEGEAA